MVNCCSSLSCLHSSRSRALGYLSILFLAIPAARKLGHICIHAIWIESFPAWPPFRVFTLLTPLPCHCPSISPRLATIEVIDGVPQSGARVAVKDPKVVDEALFKMASFMPPVKCLSSGSQVFGLNIDCFMPSSLTTWVNSP